MHSIQLQHSLDTEDLLGSARRLYSHMLAA